MMVSPCELQANRTLHAKSTGKTSLAFWPKMALKVVSGHLIFTNSLWGVVWCRDYFSQNAKNAVWGRDWGAYPQTCILFSPLSLKYCCY